MKEFTGIYWKCEKCNYLWDYNDTCPSCGSHGVYHVNIHEELDHLIKAKDLLNTDITRVSIMIKKHEPLINKETGKQTIIRLAKCGFQKKDIERISRKTRRYVNKIIHDEFIKQRKSK